MIARAAAIVAMLLAGCGTEEAPPPADELAAETTSREAAPRGPRGQAPARCQGASDDPSSIDAIWAQAEHDLPGATLAMEAAAGGFAGSATARVRLGELSLRAQPPRTEEAARWFERALALHEQGCTLAFRDRWAALEGSALARMMQGDYAGALPFLRRSIGEWPDVRSTRYNLACALCQTGDVEGCARELSAVLDAEGSAGPSWLAEQRRPPGHYGRFAREDPDLAPLRADAERFAGVLAGR